MANNNLLQLYGDFCRFLQTAESNSFFSFFQNTVQSASPTLSIFEKYVDRKIDMAWLEAIEKSIIPLDFIIRNPTTFIRRDEDIVPIAQAKNISPESVRHLSQHTNMIESVQNGRVMPSKILNINKEDSIDTYENRFVNTLLKLTSYFLDKRMSVLMKDNKVADLFDYHLDGNCRVGNDNVAYHMNMHLESPHIESEAENLINVDISEMTPMQRVERCRKIFYNFNGSSFCRSLYGTPDIRAPLVMTNKLKKNPYFVQAVDLWNFLNSYTKVGYTTDYIEQYRAPSATEKKELFSIVMMQYVMMKKQGKKLEEALFPENAEGAEESATVELTAPKVIGHAIDQLCDTFDLSVDEIRKVYEKELRKKEKKKTTEFNKAKGIFERAVFFEKEVARQAEIERRERIVTELKRRMELAIDDAKRMEEQKSAEQKAKILSDRFSDANATMLYRYSFHARLIQAQNPIQNYYTDVKNALLSFKGAKAAMSWGYERIDCGKKPLVKICIRGKTLDIIFATDPAKYLDSKYRIRDMRKEGKNTVFATSFAVRNERTLKNALEMIDELADSLSLERNNIPFVDYHEAYRSTEELLKTNPPLVKLIKHKENKADENVIVSNIGQEMIEIPKTEITIETSENAKITEVNEIPEISAMAESTETEDTATEITVVEKAITKELSASIPRKKQKKMGRKAKKRMKKLQQLKNEKNNQIF